MFADAAAKYINSFEDVKTWARENARTYYHEVDSTVGFLPVYHTLLNHCQKHEHPLLPTPQNKSESFEVKMEKLFNYAWPFHAEYRSLDRWAKVQAAQWITKGNISYKLSQVSAALLQMADEATRPTTPDYVALTAQHWDTRKKFTSNTAWAKQTANILYEQLGKKVDHATLQSGLFEVAKNFTAPVVSPSTPSKLTFKEDFHHMADAALGDVKHFDSPETWARATARNFYHQFNKTTPFVTIYSALLRKNEAVEQADAGHKDQCRYTDDSSSWWTDSEDEEESVESEHDEDEDYETESEDEDEEDEDEDYETESEDDTEDEEDEDDVSCTSEEDDTLFVKDGKQTKSGSRSGDAATRHPHPSTKDEEAHQGRLILNRILFKEYRDWYEAFEQEAQEDDQDLTAEDRFSWHCAKILSRKADVPREDCQLIVGAWLELHKQNLKH